MSKPDRVPLFRFATHCSLCGANHELKDLVPIWNWLLCSICLKIVNQRLYEIQEYILGKEQDFRKLLDKEDE